jgi:tetraacyldisaccharide 4'-kinase
MFSKFWYGEPSLLTYLLSPFSGLFRVIIYWRRKYLSSKKISFPVPIIVVGNVTVGGTGKTPFVIWLSNFLKEKGFKPGIVSRGYGGKSSAYPLEVLSNSDPFIVGDESILLARRTNCPVVIDPNRVSATAYLLKNYPCNIIISDDGLQHYKLSRDIEIVIVDGDREYGNGFCLPAGPLREPLSRLNEVDFIVINNSTMKLISGKFYNLASPELKADVSSFQGEPVHAIAGIGNPERFFKSLRQLGLTIWPHSFPDHYRFTEKDLHFNGESKIIMTEKDAVKCETLIDYRHWCLPVEAVVDEKVGEGILEKLKSLNKCRVD